MSLSTKWHKYTNVCDKQMQVNCSATTINAIYTGVVIKFSLYVYTKVNLKSCTDISTVTQHLYISYGLDSRN